MMMSAFRQYFLPGIIFQSMIVAGGYGTGQELIQFFFTIGPCRWAFRIVGVGGHLVSGLYVLL